MQAQLTNNPDLLIPLLAEKFINTSDDGKVTGKSETIASYRQTKWTSAENANVKVVVYGDTAIAIGTYKGKGSKKGKPFEAHVQWTDTWVRCLTASGSVSPARFLLLLSSSRDELHSLD